ncbi:hypothetical protein [Limosilactobacillus reuteri]|uniref:hypothetical protein n=1 Tax=Limosilactobacillus reuteri TaxID=1598 RepID=UPI002B05B052|nr:hypothetical protein [Limosilactobacillus reuteri]
MKGIYRADPTTNRFSSSDIVSDDYVLQANETFENPTGKMEPAKLVGTTWQDATPEEHEAWIKAQQVSLPKIDNGPTAQDKLNALITKQFAQLVQSNKEQATINARLTLDIANLKKQLGTTAQAQ